jgi:hypothetical protein
VTTAVKRVSEIDFRRQLVGPNGLATMLGWVHMGIRGAMTTKGWRTPVTGELGKGWPDLVLVRVRDRRLIFAELKADDGHLSADQAAVLDALTAISGVWIDSCVREDARVSKVEVHVWRPRDLEAIAEVLR